MKSLIARIVLRYLIGMFVAWAMISSEVGEEFTRDPEIQMAIEGLIGGIMVAAVEVWMVIAKRLGWQT